MIIDGRKIRDEIAFELAEQIKKNDLDISLAVIFQKNNKVSEQFVGVKKKFGQKIGISVEQFAYDDQTSEEQLKILITNLVQEKKFSAILIQLPLPKGFNTEEILNLVPAEMDPDMLSLQAKHLSKQTNFRLMPPVAGAIKEMIERYQIELQDKSVVVLGRGALVGQPTIDWLKSQKVEPKVITTENKDQKANDLAQADVVISGVGQAGLVQANQLKDGVILFDAGTSESGGQVAGDIDPKAYSKAALYTPVPGGIGPASVAVLFKNLVALQNLT